MHKKRHAAIAALLLVFSLLVFYSIRWLKTFYSGISIQEILFHIKMPLAGTSANLTSSYIKQCLVPAVGIGFAVTLAGMLFARKLIIILVESFNKRWTLRINLGKSYVLTTFLVSIVFFSLGTTTLIRSFGLIDYLKYAMATSNLYEREYVDPDSAHITFPDNVEGHDNSPPRVMIIPPGVNVV